MNRARSRCARTDEIAIRARMNCSIPKEITVPTNEKSPSASIAVKQMSFAVLPERMPRIPPDRMSDAQKKAVAELAASRGSVRGPFTATMRSPELMDRMQKLGEYIRFHCGLEPRINRMASLMVARHWTNQYEWHTAIPYALKAGLSPPISL